jgi:hypothetical protein
MNEYSNNNDQGVLVGVVLVMTILIIGGVYMVFSRLNTAPSPSTTATPEATADLPDLKASTSTTPTDLQSDAAKVDLSSLSTDISNMDQAASAQ